MTKTRPTNADHRTIMIRNTGTKFEVRVIPGPVQARQEAAFDKLSQARVWAGALYADTSRSWSFHDCTLDTVPFQAPCEGDAPENYFVDDIMIPINGEWCPLPPLGEDFFY